MTVKEVVPLEGKNLYGQNRFTVGGNIWGSSQWAAVTTTFAPPVGETICVEWRSFMEMHGYYLTECP